MLHVLQETKHPVRPLGKFPAAKRRFEALPRPLFHSLHAPRKARVKARPKQNHTASSYRIYLGEAAISYGRARAADRGWQSGGKNGWTAGAAERGQEGLEGGLPGRGLGAASTTHGGRRQARSTGKLLNLLCLTVNMAGSILFVLVPTRLIFEFPSEISTSLCPPIVVVSTILVQKLI